MSRFAVFVLLAIVCACAASDVVDLTPDNFDDVIDGSSDALVEFFAPWCGHCKRLAPEYELLGTAFKNIDGVVIAKVDADAHRSLGSRFGVSGFPTLKWFKKGDTTPEDYTGGRSADELVRWVNEKAGTYAKIKKAPTAINVLTPASFDSIVKDSNKDVLVEFYAPWCGHCKALMPKYEKVAAAYAGEENVVVANIDCDAHGSVCSQYGVSGYPTIKFFPKDNKEGEAYQGGREVKDFVDFLNDKTGTQRTEDGSLLPTAGRIESLDALATEFVGADDKEAVKAKAETAAAEVDAADAKRAKYYVKVMTKILAKGADFPANEIARLTRLSQSDAVNPVKASDFMYRINVLKAFQ